MNFKINIRKKALKFIQRQEPKMQKRIKDAIYALPFAGDICKLKGYDCLYRLRVGKNVRVLFEMYPESDSITLIDVTDADNRGQVYKS